MEKPITIRKSDFEAALIELVNSSGLPAFVIRTALSQLDTALAALEQQQLEADLAAWSAAQEAVPEEVDPEELEVVEGGDDNDG